MSLSGNLGFVSLDEVLRLLVRSRQRGAVDVTGSDVRGRVFVGEKGVDLATTSDDDELRRHLTHAGIADEAQLQRVAAGEADLAQLAGDDGGYLVELLKEMTVESLYRMSRYGQSFQVYEDESTRYASPRPFELEAILAQTKKRYDDWDEVSKTVDDLDATLRFERSIGDRDEVKVDAESWKVLSEIGDGASVRAIAQSLGTTDFWTARIAANLIDRQLIKPSQAEPQPDHAYEPAPEEPAEAPVIEDFADSQDGQADEAPDAEPAPAADESEWDGWDDSQPAADAPDPNESWWEDTVEEPVAEPAAEQAPEAEVATPAAEAETDPAEVEEDTEAFLEKVFSELESDDDNQDEGYGLLRRRRLGAIRDVSNDS